MQSGHYFFLDEISNEEKQEVIFSYKRIKLTSDPYKLYHYRISSTEAIPDYPIYLTFNEDAITFHFIGLKSTDRSNTSWINQHFEVLTLPLFPNLELKDDLSETLSKIIDEVINVSGGLYEEVPEQRSSSENEYLSITTYSSLEKEVQFSTHHEETAEKNKSLLFKSPSLEQLQKIHSIEKENISTQGEREEDKPPPTIVLPKRTLLLDFFYDFTHSTVFNNSKHQVNIELKIKECPLANALINKLEYYYARINYLKVAKRAGGIDENGDQKSWSEKLEAAEKDFVNTITPESATEVFMHSGGWLFPVEQEMKALVFNDNLHKQQLPSIIFNKLGKPENYPFIPGISLASSFYFKLLNFKIFRYFLILIVLLVLTFLLFSTLLFLVKVSLIVLQLFLVMVMMYVINESGPKKKISSRKRKKTKETYNRTLWRDWVYEEFADDYEESAKQDRILEITKLKKEISKIHLDNQLFQRAVNNFFLKRYCIHHAIRNSIPDKLRLPVGVFVILLLIVPAFLLLHLFALEINELSSFSINPSLKHQEELAGSIFMVSGVGIVCSLSMPVAYILFRYGYLDLELPTKKPSSNQFTLILNSIIIIFITSLFILSSKFNQSSNGNELDNNFFLLGGLLFSTFFIILNLKRWGKKSRFFSVLFPSALEPWLSIGCVSLFFVISGIFIETDANDLNSWENYINWFTPTALCAILFLLLLYITRRKRLTNLYWFTFNLTLPRMQMAIISSWIILISTEELWKANINIPSIILAILFIILFSLSFYYMGYVILGKIPDLNWEGLIARSVILITYGFLFSFTFGLFAMNIIGKNMLYNSGYLSDNYGIEQIDKIETKIEAIKLETAEIENAPTALTLCNAKQDLFFADATSKNKKDTITREMLSHIGKILRTSDKYYTHLKINYDSNFLHPLIVESDSNSHVVNIDASKYKLASTLKPSPLVLLPDTIFHLVKSVNTFFPFKFIPYLTKVSPDVSRQFDLNYMKQKKGISQNYLRLDSQLIELQSLENKATVIGYEKVIELALDLDAFNQKLIRFADRLIGDLSKLKSHYSKKKYNASILFNNLEESDPSLLIRVDAIHELGLSEVDLAEPRNDIKYAQSNRLVYIFPRLLMVNTILALFVGLFFQLISQDKSITEPI